MTSSTSRSLGSPPSTPSESRSGPLPRTSPATKLSPYSRPSAIISLEASSPGESTKATRKPAELSGSSSNGSGPVADESDLTVTIRLVARPTIAGIELELRSRPLTLTLDDVSELVYRAMLTYPTFRFTTELAELEEEAPNGS